MRGARLFGVTVLPILGSCTFPGVTYAPADAAMDGADEASSVDDAGRDDAEGDTDQGSDTDVAVEAGVDSAGNDAIAESGPDSSVNCDKDGDGHKAMGPPCGGDDCCDIDANAFPGQTTFFTSQDKCGSWDYDCNGAIDYEFPTNLVCSGTSLNCQGGSGFTGAPACGSSAPFCTCTGSGLGCSANCAMSTQQGCR